MQHMETGIAQSRQCLFLISEPRQLPSGDVYRAKIVQVNLFLHLLHSRRLLLGGLWLCAAAGAAAVTLGPNTRSAVLGMPLDLSMQMMPETGDNPQALCVEADVFYADKQLDKAAVGLTTEKGANAQDWFIHVRAAAPVEGPVVTVQLRAGCVRKTARRYVVLAAARPRAADQGLPGTLVAEPQALSTLASPAASVPNAPNEKLQALETELRQTREELQKKEAALAESKARLEKIEKTEGARESKTLIYGIAALSLLIGFIVLFFAYLRSISRDPAPAADSAGAPITLGPDPIPSTAMPLTQAGDTTNVEVNESLFDELRRASRNTVRESIPPLPARDRPRFSVSVPFVPRTVKVPELFDLQQQVEFFSSLGQQSEAIALLREHLVDNVKTSALVYLDLLDLYHQTGNAQDYEDLRDDFNRVFNTRIEPFSLYAPTNSGGPVYSGVLLRIQAAWPTREVFRIIEDALFREPGNPAEVLALEEYRELLLLYALVREILELEPGSTGSGDTQWPDLAMQPRSSPRLGLDIDLNQFSDGRSSKPENGRAGMGAGQVGAGGRGSGVLAERLRAREQAASASAVPPLSQPANPGPTGLDSLVDFDDYDTGYRPDDFDKSRI